MHIKSSKIYSCFVLSSTNLFHQQNLQLPLDYYIICENWPSARTTRHPCIPPTTPVLYHELSQWNIIGLIYRKSQKKAVKSNLGKILRKCNFNFFNAKKMASFCWFWTFLSLSFNFIDFLDWIIRAFEGFSSYDKMSWLSRSLLTTFS